MMAYLETSPVLRFLLGAASLVILVLGLRASADFVAPVLFAVILAILVNPLVEELRRRGIPNALALLAVSLLVVAAGLALLALIYASANRLAVRLPYYQEILALRLEPVLGWLDSRGVDASDLRGLVSGADVTRALAGLVLGLVGSLTSSLFLLFIVLFLLADGPGFVARSREMWRHHPAASEAAGQFSRSTRTQIRSQSTNNLLAAAAVTAGLLALRIDFALLWGVLSFLLAFIPNVGLIIATVPAVLLAYVQYGLGAALLVAGLVIVVNLVLDNLITPRTTGQGLNLSPAVVFLSFVFWTWVFGPLGALLATPMTVLIKTVAQSIQSTRWLAVIASARVVEGEPGIGPAREEPGEGTVKETGKSPEDKDRAA